MLFALLTLITALAIAGVAAWFSIAGLMAIFSASAIPILIMGSVLEVGKLVSASWVYRNWETCGLLLKTYLTTAVIVLMFITSMGIFGYLSKAHLEQVRPAGDSSAKMERIELRIAREKRQIRDSEKVIEQLDKVVNTLADYDKISGPVGAIATRKAQSSERQDLRNIVDAAQASIDDLEDEKFKYASVVRDLELEVGPIRYVAELVYSDAESKLDDAVRWVILIIVVVFDPLAVLLLIAANQSLIRIRDEKESTKESQSESNKTSLDETSGGCKTVSQEIQKEQVVCGPDVRTGIPKRSMDNTESINEEDPYILQAYEEDGKGERPRDASGQAIREEIQETHKEDTVGHSAEEMVYNTQGSAIGEEVSEGLQEEQTSNVGNGKTGDETVPEAIQKEGGRGTVLGNTVEGMEGSLLPEVGTVKTKDNIDPDAIAAETKNKMR